MLTEQFRLKQFFIYDYLCSLLFLPISVAMDAHICSFLIYHFIMPFVMELLLDFSFQHSTTSLDDCVIFIGIHHIWIHIWILPSCL